MDVLIIQIFIDGYSPTPRLSNEFYAEHCGLLAIFAKDFPLILVAGIFFIT